MPHGTDTATPSRRLGVIGAALMLLGIGAALVVWWPDVAFRAGLIRMETPYATRLPASLVGVPRTEALPKGDRLVIPRIAVDEPILEGDSDRALSNGVYHYPETAAPGEAGNAVIAGHRVRRAFTLLHVLEKGDAVIVYWRGREYDYRVSRVLEVGPSDTSILERGSQEQLTLYTCLPRSVGDKRTVAIAEPVRP